MFALISDQAEGKARAKRTSERKKNHQPKRRRGGMASRSRSSRIVAQSRDDSERFRERDCLVDSRRHAPSARAKINGVL